MTDAYLAKRNELKVLLEAAKPGQTVKLRGDWAFPAAAPHRWGPKATSPKDADGKVLPFGSLETDAPVILDCTEAVMGDLYWGNISGFRFVGGDWRGGIRIDGGSGIEVQDAVFTGVSKAVNVSGGVGLKVRGASFVGCDYGVLAGAMAEVLIEDNSVVSAVVDGFTLAGVQGATVRRNSVIGSKPFVGAHPDFCQVYSRANAPPACDILIEDNLVSGHTQGVGMFNHDRVYAKGTVLPAGGRLKGELIFPPGHVLAEDTKLNDGGFERVIIRRNRIIGGAPHGIGVYGARDLVLESNHLSTHPIGGSRCSINLVECVDVVRRGNRIDAGAGKPAVVDPDLVAAADPARIAELEAAVARAEADRLFMAEQIASARAWMQAAPHALAPATA
ncbi:MAG: right-handed parallel beta-helix repeat-containing protein [Pseudomonadota bacterium]